MGNFLFKFNIDFEYQLNSLLKNKQPKKFDNNSIYQNNANSTSYNNLQLNKQLLYIMSFFGASSDYIVIDDNEYLEIKDLNIPYNFSYFRNILKEYIPEIETRDVFLPWGISQNILTSKHKFLLPNDLPNLDVIYKTQHRLLGHNIEKLFGIVMPECHYITNENECFTILSTKPISTNLNTWMLKHPFGVAGKNTIFYNPKDPFSKKMISWCRDTIKTAGGILIEPLVNRIRDWGLQYFIPKDGKPFFIGSVELITTKTGGYRGHSEGLAPEKILNYAYDIAKIVQKEGYIGPLGIDTFEYIDIYNELQLRPLVELNARFTMGMAAISLFQAINLKLDSFNNNKEKKLSWIHGYCNDNNNSRSEWIKNYIFHNSNSHSHSQEKEVLYIFNPYHENVNQTKKTYQHFSFVTIAPSITK